MLYNTPLNLLVSVFILGLAGIGSDLILKAMDGL